MAKLIGEIDWYRGDSYPLVLTIKDKATKSVIDITGYSFILTVSSIEDPIDDTTKIFEVNGVLDNDPTTGVVTFTPTQTDFPAGTYYYDVQMTDASGNIRTIAKNIWNQTQDITK